MANGDTQTIDYAALAKQAGAIQSQPASQPGSVDYAALAKQAGATSSQPAQQTTGQGRTGQGQPGFFQRLAQSVGLPSSQQELEQAAAPDWSPRGIASLVFGPAVGVAEGIYGYGKRVVGNAIERANEIKEAATNISEGGPVLQNIGKAGSAMLKSEVQGLPFIGQPTQTAGEDILNRNYSGAAGGLTGVAGQILAPEIAGRTIDALKRVSPTGRVQAALGRKLMPEEATLPVGNSSTQPAYGVTPQETLQYVSQKGGKLTPGQATEDPFAQKFEALGETAAIGGKDLALAKRQERIKFGDTINNTIEAADPKRLGLSDESAGEHIQHSAQVAMGTRLENAHAAYDVVKADQTGLSGDVSPLTSYANSKAAGEYQSPQVKAALQDLASKEEALGPNPSIQSMRNLRTELWEKGNDYSGNIPDAAKAQYKTGAGIIDNQIMNAAQGTPFEESFRDASAQWKDLQQKFNEPGTVFYKILQQKDPAKITSMLQNAPATDIEALKAEGMTEALEPLKRTVLKDIANNKYGVGANGLAGYDHAYLNTLFGPDTTKQLYLQADWARRLKFQGNPSGTAGTAAAGEQLGTHLSNWEKLAKLTTAAKMSMPQDPISFLPGNSSVRTTPFQQPAATSMYPIAAAASSGGPRKLSDLFE